MLRFLASVLCLVLFASSCGGGGGEEKQVPAPIAPSAAKTIRVNLQAEPRTLDPTLVTDLVGSICLGALMEPLVSNDVNGNVIPRAAESWDHDASFRTWTFKLRKGAKWHNGDPVVAQDFVYGVQRILTPSKQGQYATYVLGFLKDGQEYYAAEGMDGNRPFTSVEAPDDYTVVYHMANPTPHFVSVVQLFSWLPLNRSAVEKGGAAWANSPDTFVGNGPYRLTKFASANVIVAEKARDTYWNSSEYFWDSVELYMIENESTENGAFLAGELDVTYSVAIPEMEFWRNRPEYRPYQFYGMFYLNPNHRRPPFNDARVRKAFSLAIDRQHIVDKVTRRNEAIAKGIVPSPLKSAQGGDWRDHAEDYVGGNNPEEARRLFAEAGYGPGGKPFPSVEYMYNTNEENKAIAEQLQAAWKEVLGVDVRLQNVEWSVRLSRAQRGDYDISLSNWYGDYLDAMTFLELFMGDSSYNVSGYKSATFDDLVLKARQEEDQVKRENFMIEAEKTMIKDDMAVIPLYAITKPILVRKDIEGVARELTGGLIYVSGSRKAE